MKLCLCFAIAKNGRKKKILFCARKCKICAQIFRSFSSPFFHLHSICFLVRLRHWTSTLNCDNFEHFGVFSLSALPMWMVTKSEIFWQTEVSNWDLLKFFFLFFSFPFFRRRTRSFGHNAHKPCSLSINSMPNVQCVFI